MSLKRELNSISGEANDVWLNSVDLNDLGRRSFELGSAHEKFGVYIRSKYTFFTWNVVYGVLAAEDEEL